MADGTTTLNAADAVKPTRSDPVSPRAARRAAIVARSAINGISFTPAKNALPASVSSAPWARRWNSAAPTSPSRSLICWLSGGWPMPTLAAALVKCRSSATARKYRMWRSSTVISKTDHMSLYHILDQ